MKTVYVIPLALPIPEKNTGIIWYNLVETFSRVLNLLMVILLQKNFSGMFSGTVRMFFVTPAD